ncbi:tRNA-dependent cyclodipeptide synthase [Candidatus Uhrbacteria bacterium]|nr:tRNA-dependent cyclodipeptide synthase [Candidatus Uhrbacteria bacterium]
MISIDPTTYPIIGMSPGNGYFKDEEVHYLLKTVVERFGRVAVLIADVPAISTYVAFGYPENRARRDKAIPRGNGLKNRVRKAMEDLGYGEDVVRIFDWEREVENRPVYREAYERVLVLYHGNDKFHASADATTRAVLEGSKKDIPDLEKATGIAVHYLLSEFAFLEFAPTYLGVDQVIYVYHKNWHVYENYIAGTFDGVPKPHLDFLLVENPYETYNPMWGLEGEENEGPFSDVLDRIEKTGILRVGFANSIPSFMYDRDYDNFSGICYEIIIEIAKKYRWQVRWSEEIGYGVIVDGLNQNRFDLFGSIVWPTPERKAQADFSTSLFRSPVFVWTRSDDGRTTTQIAADENARVAVKENDISDSIAQADFPRHRRVRVPQLSDNAEGLKCVAENRADFTFVEPYLAEHFNKASLVKLVATSADLIRVYENTFMLKRGESRLKALLDKELALLKQDGTVARLIRKYTGRDGTFIVDG